MPYGIPYCTKYLVECGTSKIDLGTKYIEKDYFLDVYGELIPSVKTPSLWTWGGNRCTGSLGDSTLINKSSPTQTISYGINWKKIFDNSSWGCHSAGIKSDGTLWLWGFNFYGQIGNNCRFSCTGLTILYQSSPTQTISQGTNWSQVSGGDSITTAIKTDGTLWTWGNNSPGSLGNNNDISRSSPVQTISQGTNWKQVTAAFSSPIAIKTDGTLWTWGSNSSGNLGDNTTINRSSPVQTVSQGNNWKQSSQFSAIKTDGTLWLWGGNNFGQLGNNDTIGRSSPVQTVSQGTNWKQVSYAAGIKTDGTLWVWGCNLSGQLGNGNIIYQSSPVQTISTGTNWKCVSSVRDNMLSIKTDGTLWLWGCNNCGQLGNDSAIGRSSPIQTIAQGSTWTRASMSSHHVVAIRNDYL